MGSGKRDCDVSSHQIDSMDTLQRIGYEVYIYFAAGDIA